jgi:pantetheine-phosphate adenylyltransferase
MKIAIFPGSFNPFHEGHLEVVTKAAPLFDKIIVAIGTNPDKYVDQGELFKRQQTILKMTDDLNVSVTNFSGLLSDFIEDIQSENQENQVVAIIRGLRNSQDFENEKTQQYWYEDTGISIPILYIISDRRLVHVSSSGIRALDKYRK